MVFFAPAVFFATGSVFCAQEGVCFEAGKVFFVPGMVFFVAARFFLRPFGVFATVLVGGRLRYFLRFFEWRVVSCQTGNNAHLQEK